LRVSAGGIGFGSGTAGTDGIGSDDDERFLTPGAGPGAVVGKIYLEAAYGHGLMRNDDSLCNTGIRLLAVYAS
jgi:hypothetical protein